MSQPLILIVGIAFSASFAGFAAEFHVAPGGNDANPGTPAKPLATILRARDAAREHPGPDVILLAPGRYFNTGVIVLDDRDSGLSIRGAQPGATAEVYGGMPVTGWTKWNNDIWRAPVPKGRRFYNLIVDDKPATMAQTPNAGSGFRGGAEGRGNAAVQVPAEWRGYDYSDAQVFAFIGANWFSEMREVLAAAPDAQGLLPLDGGSGGLNGMNERFFLRGVLDLLDEPGEWCLKHKEGYVYYWPENRTPAEHLIIRPTAQRLIEVKGRAPQTPAKNISLENLSLIGSDFCARWYLFGPNEDGSTPKPLQHGLVFGENVEALAIRKCRVLAAGHSGVWFNYHARNCVVEDSLISGAGFAGVYANGYLPGEGPFKSGPESYVNKGHRIENNFIYDCGRYVGHGCGIQFFQSGDAVIARNEIGEAPRYGISFKGAGSVEGKELYGHRVAYANRYDYIHTRNLKVVGNEIYSVCRNSYDFGGIESWFSGRDNLWAGNHLHDIDQALNWDGWGHVLFADDASDFLTISGNIVHHCNGGAATGAMMLKSVEQTIENNLVADCQMGRLVTFEPYGMPAWNMSIRYNIFAVDGTHSRYGNVSEFSIKGKTIEGVSIPPGVTGVREVDCNWINPRDPKNPNPLAHVKLDLHSTFGPAPVKRSKPYWDAMAEDYVITDPVKWFKPLDATRMGLKRGFPFDIDAAKRRSAFGKIQAEAYQRSSIARTSGGVGIYNLQPGAWTKYSSIDFGKGVRKAVFQLDAPPAAADAPKRYVRKTADSVIEAIPFKGDMSVETVPQWEISKLYTQPGKTGTELFDVAFPPETDAKAGDWSLLLEPATSKGGKTPEQGVVDFYVAHGEGARNACAYARASIHAQKGRTNATMTINATGGAKVWLNGELIISSGKPGTYSETVKGVLKDGWNAILIKVNQQPAPDAFSFKFGTVASACGKVVALPGLPDRAQESGTFADTILNLCLDSPEGRVIGQLEKGRNECPVENVRGIHNLYLVFPGGEVRMLDNFRFEP
jgi:hypothetical protein